MLSKLSTNTSTEKYFGVSGMITSRYLDNNKPYDGYFFKSGIKDN
jgi:hypothetical protein